MLPELIDGHCKAKISKFVHSLQMKHVRRFYIPVHEASLMDFCVSFDELSHDFDGFVVGQGFSLSKDVVEIPFAQFRDDVGVVFGGVHVVEVQHVFGLTQLFQGGDLELEQHLVDGVFEFVHLYDFDGDGLLSGIAGAFVDGGGVSLTDVLADGVGVAFDGFHVIVNVIM